MKTCLVSFATREFYESQRLLNRTALEYGIDEVISYTRESITCTEFYKKNKKILDQRRGAGYWLWKPYIILEALSSANEGDIVMYSDAGNEVIASLEPLFEICEREEILVFQVHRELNRFWTKRDCFIAMGCDNEKFYEAEQVAGTYQLYLCGSRSKKLVSEWLDYCQIDGVITDAPNRLGKENLPEFKDHRHDQSVFSLLAMKWGLNVYRDPSQWGDDFLFESRFTNSTYSTLFNLHRLRGWTFKLFVANRLGVLLRREIISKIR